MAKAVRILPIVRPAPDLASLADNIGTAGQRYAVGSYSWYNQLVQTAHKRLMRYNDYDVMDEDVDVSRALDIVADEIVGSQELGTNAKIEIDISDEDLPAVVLEILEMSLKVWAETVGLETRLFHIARNMVKYGDCFFMKPHANARWIHIHPRTVLSAIVDQTDGSTPLGWSVKLDGNEAVRNAVGSQAITSLNPASGSDQSVATLNSHDVVRFTMCDDMSQTAPFGESILKPVVKAFKQKELLEDAVIIYRVQRAPERRVFYIDVGKSPLPIAQQILEQTKNEIKQKKIPRPQGGTGSGALGVDSVYDPLSTNEDYFFPVREGARGSRVETLPGGNSTGEVDDLDYFRRRMWRGLKIPYSYIEDGSDNAGAMINDGKTGVAYIQEQKFNLMVQRLQQQVNTIIDLEFKRYLKHNDIIIDTSKFKLKLPTPQNFAVYQQQQRDADLLQNFSSIDGVGHVSKRMGLMHYLQWTQQQVMDNERDLKEELGLDPDDDTIPAYMLYNEKFREALIDRAIQKLESIPEELKNDSPLAGMDDMGDDFGDDSFGGGGGGLGPMPGGSMGGDDFGGDEFSDDLGGDEFGDEGQSPDDDMSMDDEEPVTP